jgi:hypothetical protein
VAAHGGRTALVVADRPSTVVTMDQLIVVECERIVEQGTHRGVLASDGAYAKLWQHQSVGFLDDTGMPKRICELAWMQCGDQYVRRAAASVEQRVVSRLFCSGVATAGSDQG